MENETEEIVEGTENENGGEDNRGEDNREKPEKTFTQKELNALLAKERKKHERELTDKLEEVKKTAKMTADEQAEYARKQAEKTLAEREAAVTKRELMAAAKAALAEKGLPTELAGVLDYSDKDACDSSLDAVSKAFSASVETAVNKRLKQSGGAPKTGKASGMSGIETAFYKLNPNIKH